MSVAFLPIVSRELRAAARKKSTYWARCSAAAGVLLIGAWFLLIMPYVPPAVVAQGLFSVIGGAALLFAFVSGPHFTADCLSEEKREGTLGLLFLTDLKGYDVVLGKLFATSLNAFYGMLAMLPLMAVPLLIGGVNIWEVVRMSLVAVNTMFMSLAAGLFVSSMSRNPRKASGYALLLLVVLALVLPGLAAWLDYERNTTAFGKWGQLASPAFAFRASYQAYYGTAAKSYWTCMATINVLGWIFLVGASLIVPNSWRDRAVGGRWPASERLANFFFRAPNPTAREQMLSINPFYWLASRGRTKPLQVWLALAACAALWFWGWHKLGREWLDPSLFITTGLVMNALMKGWFASECTRQLSEDRHRGALELLLSTPLTVREIMTGLRLALQRQFLGPMAVLLMIYGFIMVVSAHLERTRDQKAIVAIWLIGILIFVCDLVAMYWYGAWMALQVKNPKQAASLTSLIVLIIPWVLFAAGMIFVVQSMIRSSPSSTGLLIMFLWAVTALGVDAFVIYVARDRVLTGFREMATARFRT